LLNIPIIAVSAIAYIFATYGTLRQVDRRVTTPLTLAIAVSIAVSFWIGYGPIILLFATSIVALSTVMAVLYRGGKHFYTIAIVLMACFAYTLINPSLIFIFAQMMGIGTIAGFLYLEKTSKLKVPVKKEPKVEVRRDLFQVGLGIVILATALVFPAPFKSAIIITYGVIAAFLYNKMLLDFGKGTKMYSQLLSLERKKTIYGLGAMYAAGGLLLLLGFMNDYSFLAVSIFALFIADPLATLVGYAFKSGKIFYNKNKSVAGTLTFFFATAIFGYFFLGTSAVLLAAAFALVESINIGIDDNVLISIIAVAVRVFLIV
jgi:dolichol kinase